MEQSACEKQDTTGPAKKEYTLAFREKIRAEKFLVFEVLTTLLLVVGLFLVYLEANAEDGRFRGMMRERIKERLQTYGPGDYDFSLTHDTIKRDYKVHIPPSYSGKVSTPIVIYLHGGGGSSQTAFRDGMDWFSDKFGFILVSPAGTGPIPDRWLVWNGGKWDGGECCGDAVKNDVDDVGFISEMVDEIKDKFNVDGKRIYATGISNGGLMAYRLACELSEKIAAVAAVAPPAVPQNCIPLRPISIMHIHGTADPCVPFKGGIGGGCLGNKRFEGQPASKIVNLWNRINNCSTNSITTYRKGNATCISYLQCEGKTEVEFCKIEGGGHTWPSGFQYLPVSRIGPVSYDLSFDQIWEFFIKHPMGGKNKNDL